MGIFPFMDVPAQRPSNKELPLFKEYAWNFETGEYLLHDGKMMVIEGNEALKVWIYKALRTDRFKHLAYSWNFGHEFERVIGSTFSPSAIQSEMERYVKEALTVNPYIKDVFDIRTKIDGDTVNVECTVTTVYGEMTVNV
ncbi:DUF2634 domain-containing protein [Paenibacillus tyrfis]|uniref:DUF2634 domain-containing protein n=1 Tax=Paenibacillus tyrfis TaxID=1501230 RepID=A0A081P4G2_9BACL|nr:DUF2634 domain-containing protein [Paenibacillus tyrfis]KEQ25585.1 hypothetical protein ET33_02370 [Paenibacillus tyrfis]